MIFTCLCVNITWSKAIEDSITLRLTPIVLNIGQALLALLRFRRMERRMKQAQLATGRLMRSYALSISLLKSMESIYLNFDLRKCNSFRAQAGLKQMHGLSCMPLFASARAARDPRIPTLSRRRRLHISAQ